MAIRPEGSSQLAVTSMARHVSSTRVTRGNLVLVAMDMGCTVYVSICINGYRLLDK